ncbi:alpha/beta hydrolase [Rhodococcoides yunnanense]|nr:alpha/beta hydrolase [Rhodococcus yunnanensis]
MKIVSAYLRIAVKPTMSTAAKAREAMEEPKTTSVVPRVLRRTHAVNTARIGGFTSYRLQPRTGAPTHAVLYLHGGAYSGEIAPQHWDLVSAMVSAGLRVDVPIYGLTPQFTYRDAYEFIVTLYTRLRAEADSVAVMGDSSGGALALGLVQHILDHGGRPPERLVLISPWLDLTLTNPDIADMESRDPWLTRAGLIEAGRAWAGGDDPTVSALSPINGTLAGLPATEVYIGTHDIFHPDTLELRDRAARAGSDVQVIECAGAVHVYPLVPAPEGRKARAAIVASVTPDNARD